MSGAYYSEFDPKAAAWLRELIKQGHIADGIVDERDLWDVSPTDLKGFTQVHLCAGIGVWSYALRRSGWEDSTECWTASFPCQPFSAAGKGLGFADERHLWPAGLHLIRELRPSVVFGEQVASKDGLNWLDLVQADLEGSGYACGAVDLCAAGLGAPHIRQRLYWTAERMADAAGSGQQGQGWGGEAQGQRAPERGLQDGLVGLEHAPSDGRIERRAEPSGRGFASGRGDGGVGDPHGQRRDGLGLRLQSGQPRLGDVEASGRSEDGGVADAQQRHRGPQATATNRRQSETDRPANWPGGCGGVSGILAHPSNQRQHGRGAGKASDGGDSTRQQSERFCDAGGVADTKHDGCSGSQGNTPQPYSNGTHLGLSDRGHFAPQGQPATGPTNGYWRDADWLYCRDGKWRPVEPGTFPLAHGSPARVGRLRGYGNAIVAPAAQAFIEAYLDARRDAAEAGEAPALQA